MEMPAPIRRRKRWGAAGSIQWHTRRVRTAPVRKTSTPRGQRRIVSGPWMILDDPRGHRWALLK